MENSFLLKFLELGLFDIGEQDERLDQLQSAIENVKSDLTQHQAKLPQYILVALDKDISPDEPVLLEVEKQVTQHWKTLRQRHKNRPVVLLRGVILNALFELGNATPQFSRIIYLVGSNFYLFASLGKEKELVFDQLQSFGEKAESEAVSNWALKEGQAIQGMPNLKIAGVAGKKTKPDISYNTLKASLKKAADRSPQGHMPSQQNHLPHWAEHFSEEATTGISAVMDEVLNNIQDSLPISHIQESINKFFTKFNSSLNQALQNSLGSLMAVERRSKLLWWKETLYSQSQRKSYRDITKTELLPVVMAYDLLEQLPDITPVSVDYLLRDMFFLLLAKKDKKTTFSDYFKGMQEHQEMLKQYFDESPNPSGRISITDFIALLMHERVKVDDFKERTGIDLQESIKPSDLSVVILHDLLCKRLISN